MSAKRLAVAAMLLALGCQTPARFPLPYADAEALRLGKHFVAGLRTRSETVRGLRGRARVSLEGDMGSSFARQLLLIERPASLRVEVIGLLNQRLAILATDGEQYELFRREQPGIERGRVHPGVLWEVAGVPLTPEQAVAVLLGAPPLPDATPESPMRARRGEDRVSLEILQDPGLYVVEFDGLGRLRRYRVELVGGETLLEVRYDDLREVGGGYFAYDVAFSFPAQDARATVSFREVELNPELPAPLFRLDAASG